MSTQEFIKDLTDIRILGNIIADQLSIREEYEGKLSRETEVALDNAIKSLISKYSIATAKLQAKIKG